MKLSICMMVKNEERYLDGCLKSLTWLMNKVESELIIVDTGSNDNTVEIAKKYTDKVYFHLWNNDFASMRNISLSYAKGEWVLIIDADEEIEDAEGLISFLKSKESDNFCAGLIFIRSIAYSGKESGYGYSTAVRLFKNDEDLKFENSIHENVKVKGQVINLNTTFIHYGYMYEDTEVAEKKFIRNRDLLLSELKKDPQNIQFMFYLSSAYRKHDDFKEALHHIKNAYEIMKAKKYTPKDYVYLYPQLAFCLIENDMYEAAKKICQEGLKIDQNNMDLTYSLARLLFSTRDCDEALIYYNRYLKLHEDKDNYSKVLYNVPRISTMNRQDEAYIDMAAIYIMKEQYDEAKEHLNNVKTKEYLEKFFVVAVELYIRTKEYDLLKKIFEGASEEDKEMFFDILLPYKDKIMQNEWQQVLDTFSKGDDICSKCISTINDLTKKEEKINPDKISDKYLIKNNANNTRVGKLLFKYLLSDNKLADDIYNKLFEKYIKAGIEQLKAKYGSKPEMNKMKNYEEKFLLNLMQAEESKDNEKYVKYLKSAAENNPSMGRGIKYLLQSNTKTKTEFEQYQDKIRETVSLLIDSGQFESAKVIIDEYKKIVKNDSIINKLEEKMTSVENK
jgi:glycosyltransferase involved in cell wall biosynthesis